MRPETKNELICRLIHYLALNDAFSLENTCANQFLRHLSSKQGPDQRVLLRLLEMIKCKALFGPLKAKLDTGPTLPLTVTPVRVTLWLQ